MSSKSLKVSDAYVMVGQIGSVYGIKGWLKVQVFPDFCACALENPSWYLSDKQNLNWQPIPLQDIRPYKKGYLAKFIDIDTPEEAKRLTGLAIGLEQSRLPTLKEGEYYWSMLKGLTVINKDGRTLGKIFQLIETGSNDVLVVKGAKEYAIPYLPGRVILNVDLQKKEMLVDWEEG